MIETGVLVGDNDFVFWHLPPGRTGGSLPDSRELWDVFWAHRKDAYLGFAHSHPGKGVPGPSWEDITTFAGVEAGLGRRVRWWITSSDHLIALHWKGPDRYDYDAVLLAHNLHWVDRLRALSNSNKQENGHG
jgi:hypothetical protein